MSVAITRIITLWVALIGLLTACATQAPVAEDSPEELSQLSQVAFTPTLIQASNDTPLDDYYWFVYSSEMRVPLPATGTTFAEVMTELQDWQLEPQILPDAIVVLEGESVTGISARDPVHVIYIFKDGKLEQGPLDADYAVMTYLQGGLQDEDYERVQLFLQIESEAASIRNNLAWSFATSTDPGLINPDRAVEEALLANELSNYERADFIDTLAAAYAVAGDFDLAQKYQEQAITVAGNDNEGMLERLQLFREGRVYVEDFMEVLPQDVAALRSNLMEFVRNGDAAAQFQLALLCIEHDLEPCDEDNRTTDELIKLSAEQGFPDAVGEIGFGYMRGQLGFEQDTEQALLWFRKAVLLDNQLAMYNIAMMHRDALGVTRDDEKTTRLLRIVSERDVPEAGVETAYRLLEGVGAKADPVLSQKYFQLAANAGFTPFEAMHGQNEYDFYYYNNAGHAPGFLEIDFQSFPEYLMSLVDRIESQLPGQPIFVLARMPDHFTAWPLADAPRVIHVLTLIAARFGSRRAQEKLADLYERGEGVEHSAAEAEYWRERAARNNSGL